jgi:hypothetical protein
MSPLAVPDGDCDSSGGPRLLLLEFLNPDRFSQYRSELFPFVAGYARAHEVPVRWVAFGVPYQGDLVARYTKDLVPDDRASLLQAVAEHRATHVVSNEHLADGLEAALRAARPGLRLAPLTSGGPAPLQSLGALGRWLSLPADDDAAVTSAARLADAAEPDYRCELRNPLARQIRPLIEVVAGPVCLFARSVRDNPAYRGVPLPPGVPDRGCAFCGHSLPMKYPYRTAPVPLAMRQIRAAVRTCPPERFSGEFRVGGIAVFFKLRELVETLLSESLPPVHLLFGCRIDELLRMAPVIDELLPRLAAAGHGLDIENMGAESLARRENERFNKHISTAQVEAALGHLRRWERDWPDAFAFSRHGGFGFITFTPWTSLEDLEENARAAQRLGLPIGSLFATSRLILLPGLPVTVLAEHDGLVVPSFPDPVVAEMDGGGCLTSRTQTETPWRFRHRGVGLIYSVLARAVASGTAASPDDALARTIRATLTEGWGGPLAANDLLLWLIAAAKMSPQAATVDELLESLRSLAPAAALPAPAPEVPVEASPAAPAGDEVPTARHDCPRCRAVREMGDSLARDRRRPLRGFEVKSVECSPDVVGWGEVRLSLQRGDERLELLVRGRDGFERPYLLGVRFALGYCQDTPLDPPERRQIARAVITALDRLTAGE